MFARSSKTLRYAFLATFLFWAQWAAAQELLGVPPEGNDHTWDCWISEDWKPLGGYLIRCVRDRDVVLNDPIAGTPTAAVLDYVHDMIHQGETLQLDQDLARGVLSDLNGHIWQIRIHRYPTEDSWQEMFPHQLVQGLMCTQSPLCQVLIQR